MILNITTPEGTTQHPCTITLSVEGVDHLDPTWTLHMTGNTQCQLGNSSAAVYVNNAVLIPLPQS